MTREEFIGKLQMVYVGDRNAFNEIVYDFNEKENINDKLSSALTSAESRIDKAIDVLEELIAEFQLNNYITDFDKKMNKPLNILKGSDKN